MCFKTEYVACIICFRTASGQTPIYSFPVPLRSERQWLVQHLNIPILFDFQRSGAEQSWQWWVHPLEHCNFFPSYLFFPRSAPLRGSGAEQWWRKSNWIVSILPYPGWPLSPTWGTPCSGLGGTSLGEPSSQTESHLPSWQKSDTVDKQLFEYPPGCFLPVGSTSKGKYFSALTFFSQGYPLACSGYSASSSSPSWKSMQQWDLRMKKWWIYIIHLNGFRLNCKSRI